MAGEKKPSSEDIILVPLDELEQEWVAEQAMHHSPMMYEDISGPDESPFSDDSSDASTDESSDESEQDSKSELDDEDERLTRLVETQKEIIRLLHENAKERAELTVIFEDIMKKLEEYQ